MKKLVIEMDDLPDIGQVYPENDRISYIISQAKKGKKITVELIGDKFKLSDRASLAQLNRLVKSGHLKSYYANAYKKDGKLRRMRIFVDAKCFIIDHRKSK